MHNTDGAQAPTREGDALPLRAMGVGVSAIDQSGIGRGPAVISTTGIAAAIHPS